MRFHDLPSNPITLRSFDSDYELVKHLQEEHPDYHNLSNHAVGRWVQEHKPFLVGTPSSLSKAKVTRIQQKRQTRNFTPARYRSAPHTHEPCRR